MDHKEPSGTVPPYEATPSSYPQHAPMQHQDSYGAGAGQPMVQHDIYQSQPAVSPMQTGTTNTYPNQPPGSPPPLDHLHSGGYIQPAQQQQTPIEHPKGDYYGGQQQQQQQGIPMQQVHTQPMQQQQHNQGTYLSTTPLQNLGEAAAPADCPVCRHRALTRTEFHSGNTTNLWALVICAVFCLGCIPYLITGLKDVEHKCGNCGVMLATWKRSGRTVVHQHG